MTLRRLLWHSLLFHWRGNLAVLLGVAVGTAVLTGALLVGDSLKGSLRDLAQRQLGWVDQTLVTPKFFRTALARELQEDHIAPAILLQGAATAGTPDQDLRRAGRVMILGVDDRFWNEHDGRAFSRSQPEEGFWASDQAGVVLNQPLAAELRVKVGDSITLHLLKASAVHRETLLGRREYEDTLSKVEVKVRAILPPACFANDFNLVPSPAPPRNAYVPLRFLQEKLEQPGRANALLAGGPANLQAKLARHLTLADWGLSVFDPDSRAAALFARLDKNNDGTLSRREWLRRVPQALEERAGKSGDLTKEAIQDYYRQHPYLSLESRQAILEPTVVEAAQAAAKDLALIEAPTLVYLANNLADGVQPFATAVAALAPDPVPLAKPAMLYRGPLQVPYSIAAGLDTAQAAPLGPFLPAGKKKLGENEIVLVDWPGWKETGLDLKPGMPIAVTYFVTEEQGQLRERTQVLKLAGMIPLAGVAADPDLTPEFPGITDQLDLADWVNPPFPYDKKRIRPNDIHDVFWKEHRTTPKAYVSLKNGQELWGNRFGNVTSIRFAPPADSNLHESAEAFRAKLLQRLDPAKGGFVFDQVKQRSLEASSGGTDFGMLFLGFSFFLIVAALLLVGLLVRLNLDRRAGDIGLLLALGYRTRTVRRLLLGEGTLLAALGGVVGTGIAIGYAWLLVDLLRSWWPGGLERSFLTLHVTPLSLAIGYVGSLIVSVLTIAWAVRVLGKATPRALLGGEAEDALAAAGRKPPRWSIGVAVLSFLGGAAAIAAGGKVHGHEAQAGTFFTGGFLLLTSGLAVLWIILRRADTHRDAVAPRFRVASLALRNAARHPVRSLLTAGLLASAAFLIVAVESFRRQPDQEFLAKTGGSGGFPLLAEADVPVYQDLNVGPGREELNDALEKIGRKPDVLAGVTFVPFRVRAGDDASCLNLFQPRQPRLLGVPKSLIDRGGFAFAATLPENSSQPWQLLQSQQPGGAIPVFGEANTVQWMLKSGLGNELEVADGQGKPAKLRIVGTFKDSVFQGELLMSEENFLKLYPSQEGYNFFLIDAPAARTASLKPILETALAGRGFEVTPSQQRLAAYLAVENTYLSTFQALGGLGLLLGALGLAVVLLRSVWERRGEMALLRALGFRRQILGWLVLVENALLLSAGLGIGTAAALASVAPHVLAGAGDVPVVRLVGLLLLVLVVGLAAGVAAMASTLRAPLLPALRRE